jgi:hypothetical protein
MRSGRAATGIGMVRIDIAALLIHDQYVASGSVICGLMNARGSRAPSFHVTSTTKTL